MKNLDRLVQEVKNDFESLGIEYGKITKITINTRAKSRWGQCHRKSVDIVNHTVIYEYDININVELLDDELDDMAAKNTIAHEFIHTIEGCFNHGKKFNEIGSMLSIFGYNIQRTTSAEEKGIVAEDRAIYKYKIVCPKCNHANLYQKRSKVIQRIETGYTGYRCSCGCGLRANNLLKIG